MIKPSPVPAANYLWFIMRDRGEFAQGDPEAIAILRFPVVGTGIDPEENYNLEHFGDLDLGPKKSSVAYKASTNLGSLTVTFLWGADAEKANIFHDLMAGTYVNTSIGGIRMMMPLEQISEREVDTLLAMDALDFYDCTRIKVKDRDIVADVLFQGREIED